MMRTAFRSSLAVLIMCLFGPAAMAAEASEVAALRAAHDWLAVVDGGDYEESWSAAAAYFKGAIGQAQWAQALNGVRRPLGAVLARDRNSATHATELPGAPDAEYVVAQFTTAFENKRAAIETVTPMLDDDGVWRVAGYFINRVSTSLS